MTSDESSADRNSTLYESDTSESDCSDFEDSWIYDETINHSRLTIKDHAAAIMALCLRHNLSTECINDILKMIHLHLPDNNRCLSNYGKIKSHLSDDAETETINYIEYCEKCFVIWPEDSSIFQCPTNLCTG